MAINLVYMSPNPFGGWVTFTSHLAKGLGRKCLLRKVRKKTERTYRDFGYGLSYNNIAVEDLLNLDMPTLITAVHKSEVENAVKLLEAGAWIVIHDPNEFHLLDIVPDRSKVITIRKSVAKQIPESTLIPHPYQRSISSAALAPPAKRRKRAVSVARIDFDKNTHILLGANRLLPEGKKIELHGFENRLYGKFKLMKQFPEWEQVQSTHKFDRVQHAAPELCSKATYAVDMSIIKDDGGGTQYTFLEAMDGGAVNVLNCGWIMPKGEMVPNLNCLTVEGPEDLAKVIQRMPSSLALIQEQGYKLLKRHDASVVANQVRDLVEG